MWQKANVHLCLKNIQTLEDLYNKLSEKVTNAFISNTAVLFLLDYRKARANF